MGTSIYVRMSDDPDDIVVEAHGSEVRLATDRDLKRFGLRQRNNYGAGGNFSWDLWGGVYHTHEGRYPDGVHFSNHDIYNDPSWISQVQLRSKAVGAKLISHEVNADSFASRRYRNRRAIPTQEEIDRGITQIDSHGCELSKAITDTVGHSDTQENSWSVSSTLSVEVGGDAAGYKVGASFTAELGGSTSETDSTEHSVTREISDSVDVPLGPGKAARATLMAGQGTLEVQVRYEMTLAGDVAVNFHQRDYHGKHWTTVPVERFMQAMETKPPLKLESWENIKIGFVTDGEITVEDIPMY